MSDKAFLILVAFSLSLAGSIRLVGQPIPSDYDVFLEAESPSESNGFISEGSPRADGCSGIRWLNLWRPLAPPSQTGYFAKYRVQAPQTGKYWVLVWAQGLDTGCSSPFWVSIGGKNLHFAPKTAAIPEHYYRYGHGMALHSMGPISLTKGTHSLTLTVKERRSYKADGEKQGAYNLIVDALALTTADPSVVSVKAPAEIAIDARTPGEPFVPIIDMSQGGIGEVVDPNFWASMSPMLRKIGLGLMRIDHIWDYYGIVSRDAKGEFKYDWSRFDAVMEHILATGARPFFSVSYLPEPLRKNGIAYGLPSDYQAWKAICSELVRHMKSRWKLTGLHYELWNEPDGGGFWSGTQQQYFELYKSTCEGILSVDPTAKMGGPATALSGWVEAFVKFARQNNLQLDFVSWHWYNCTYDVNVYASQIDAVRATLAKAGYSDKVETFFTEWNLNGNILPVNDMFYNAGNIAATLNVFHEKKTSHAFFFFPKDPKGDKELAGWFGAITWNNKPKPAYNCFDAYSRLKGRQIPVNVSDKRVSALAAVEKDTVRILVWHFDGTTPFGPKRNVRLSAELPAGTYERSSWLIDSKHSNLSATPDKPGLTLIATDNVTIKDGSTLRMDFDLENGGVELLEFTRKGE